MNRQSDIWAWCNLPEIIRFAAEHSVDLAQRDQPEQGAVERGSAPVADGLILSGGIAVLRVSPGDAAVWSATVVALLGKGW
jgi:hypothetical protein